MDLKELDWQTNEVITVKQREVLLQRLEAAGFLINPRTRDFRDADYYAYINYERHNLLAFGWHINATVTLKSGNTKFTWEEVMKHLETMIKIQINDIRLQNEPEADQKGNGDLIPEV